jgi:AraC-like DNA-binding protein
MNNLAWPLPFQRTGYPLSPRASSDATRADVFYCGFEDGSATILPGYGRRTIQFGTSYLAGIGVFLSIFLSSLIFARPGPRKARLYLAAFILSSGLSITYELLFPTGLFRILPHAVKTYIPPQLLLGPFLYFYVSSALDEGFSPSRRSLLHLAPFVLVLAYLAPFFGSAAEAKIAFVESSILSGAPSNPEEWLVWIGFQGSLWAYALACAAKLRVREKRAQARSSAAADRVRRWLSIFLGGIFGVLGLFLVVDALMLAGIPLTRFNPLISIIVTADIAILGWRGIANLDHVAPSAIVEPMPLSDAESWSRRFRETRNAIDARGLYRDPDLTLPILAERLGCKRNELSRIINAGGSQSFHDFLNGLRVEEVRRKLEAGGDETRNLLSLAFDAGFRSKSTFNEAFKRCLGSTPSHYRKRAGAGKA